MKKFILSLLLSASLALAAISANTVFEVRPTNGVDTNGGGFVTGASGTDFSQQNAAQFSGTDLASTSGTTNPCIVTSATHNFVATDVGNIIQVSAGTNWTTGFYQIVSVGSNAATFDRACGTAASITGGTWAEGGALKTITKANGAMVAGNIAWVKAEATITTTASIAINFTNANSGQQPGFNGYTTTRNDGGQVTVQATATLANNPIFNVTSAGATMANFILDCNAQTNTDGINLNSTGVRGYNLLIKNCPGSYGVLFNNSGTNCTLCTVTVSSGTAAFNWDSGTNSVCVFCVAYNNSTTGFVLSGGLSFYCAYCISASNTGVGSDGFTINTSQGNTVFIGSIAYKNGRDGFRLSALGQQQNYLLLNSISFGNTGFGFNSAATQIFFGTPLFDYNAYGSNTAGNTNNWQAGAHDVTLTVDPFVAGGSQNFALNNTSGGGLGLKSAGFPGALAVGGTGSAAIGTLQPAASGGAGGQNGYISNN